MTSAWQLKGSHVLWMALAFFAFVIAANGIMVTVALQTFSGAEQDDAYVKGLNYNETLAEKEEAAKAGWAAKVAVSRGDANAAHILVRLTRQNAAADGLSVTAIFRHPSDAHRDRSIVLEPRGDGRYEGVASDIAPGSWDVVVDVQQDGRAVLDSRLRSWLP